MPELKEEKMTRRDMERRRYLKHNAEVISGLFGFMFILFASMIDSESYLPLLLAFIAMALSAIAGYIAGKY